MKKLICILCLSLTLLSLVACGGPADDGGEGDGGVIFSPDVSVSVVRGEDAPETAVLEEIVEAIRGLTGRMPTIKSDASETSEHEIVIGSSEREVSLKAYEELGEAIDGYVSYLIYSDGNSLAIAYRDNADRVAMQLAIEYFKENYLSGETLTLGEGVVHRDTVELYAYYTELDERYTEEKWAELEREGGKAIVEAMRELYSIYSDKAVEWLANLYDPSICFCGECEPGKGCGGGGFYYSASARDTGGYLPDAESTAQALSLLSGSGMAHGREGGYAALIGGEMREDIIHFIKSLQDPESGYFYHPQWGKDYTDTNISRRARDLDWSTSILKAFGEKPRYDAPNGTKGENRNTGAAFSLTMPLGGSAVAAVSRVITVASASYAAHLESDETFRAYLAKMNIGERSYHVGSELVTQDSQILARDVQLAEAGKDYSLMEILIEWLNENQHKESGHWHGESSYYAINGLYKIARIYNAAKVAMPNARAAAMSAIAALSSDEVPSAVVDVYNIWAAISNCISNLKNYGGNEGVAEAEAIIGELRALAPDAIRESKVKVAIFRKNDGSFSYLENSSAHTSTGMPVAVQGTDEGDVNATSIAIVSLSSNIYSALGLSSAKVPVYTYTDFLDFAETVANIGYVEKLEIPNADEPYTFDDEWVGDAPTEIPFVLESAGGATVLDDPREGKDGNVIELKSLSGGRDYVFVPCKNAAQSASTYIFEGDFCVTETDPSYTTQITLGGCYMFTFRANADGKVKLVEASSNSEVKSRSRELGAAPKVGEWFNVRVEFYVGDHESVRIKFYYNSELIAVSDNYYDASGAKLSGVGTPSNRFDGTQIFVMKSSNATILMDNLLSYKANTPYEKPEGYGPAINIDAPERPVTYEGFDDGKLPESVAPTSESEGGHVEIVSDPRGDGKVLEIKSHSGGRDFIYLSTQEKSNATCYVFESELCVSSCDPEYFSQITIGSVYMLTLRADASGDIKIVEASSNSESKSRTQELGVSVKVGEWFKLRAEYYLGDHDSVRIKIYFNGELIAVTDNYYDKSGVKLSGVGTPSKVCESVRIIVMSSYNATLLIDNAASYMTTDEYVASDEDLIINVDKDGK